MVFLPGKTFNVRKNFQLKMPDQMLYKILVIFTIFVLYQLLTSYSILPFTDKKMTMKAEIQALERKKDNLNKKIINLKREKHRLELQFEKIEIK